MNRVHRVLLASLASLLFLSNDSINAQAPGGDEGRALHTESQQRVPVTIFDVSHTTMSAIELYASNTGVVGQDVANSRGSLIWPRGSGRSYILGGGFWFGAEKDVATNPGDPGSPVVRKKLVTVSYEPRDAMSYMVPGRVRQSFERSVIDSSPEAINNYRIYRSTDYDPVTGEPLDPVDRQNGGARWPLWNMTPVPEVGAATVRYVAEMPERNRTSFPGGPAIRSDEELFATYKDTDLSAYWIYGTDSSQLGSEGYPIGLQVEQTIHSWSSGVMRDAVIIHYAVINVSDDTLYNCYAAPMFDPDLGTSENDHASIVPPQNGNDSIDMGVVWTDREDAGRFAYMGLDLLESPAVDRASGFVRHDKERYDHAEQRGLSGYYVNVIREDPETSVERYDALAAHSFWDDADSTGDLRVLLSTGPFHMKPNDTARFAVAIMFAPKTEGGVGLWEGMQGLIDYDREVQAVWDDGLRISVVDERGPDDLSASGTPHLLGSFPNPVGAAGSATILYDLPLAARAELRLYDPIGRLVERRDLGYGQGVGRSVGLDCSGLAAGVYTYEIRTAKGAARGSMTVLR